MRPGDFLRAVDRDIVLCKKGEELQQIGAIRSCRVDAQISPCQTVEVSGE